MAVPEPQAPADEPSATPRARLQKAMLVLPGLFALAAGALLARLGVVNSHWRSIFGDELAMTMVLALIAMPVMMILYAIGYAAARSRGSGVRDRAWALGLVLPGLAAVALIATGVLDRLFPGRLFERFSGHELPASARVVFLDYEDKLIENHFTIAFDAPAPEIERLLEGFGTERRQATGVEVFDSVPVCGDHGELEVDWDRSRVTFRYLNV